MRSQRFAQNTGTAHRIVDTRERFGDVPHKRVDETLVRYVSLLAHDLGLGRNVKDSSPGVCQ